MGETPDFVPKDSPGWDVTFPGRAFAVDPAKTDRCEG